ncbi:hypothetical protein R1sor_017140 [Riccia sorocarpa]|uniref:FCP1 homology domain-containing protein n=1 Tax=Riccia sorocarpa TaxID=122646 RepID=A0ABD3I5Y2_9MARC
MRFLLPWTRADLRITRLRLLKKPMHRYLGTPQVKIQTQPKSKKKGRGALALTDKSLWPALDFMQMDNTLVKPVDLLPRKLLILDVEGLLLYAEGFMDKTSRTDCGDVISNGMKAVVRRNGVQALMSRCLELFDVALWSCCSHNTLWDYTHYLFSGE